MRIPMGELLNPGAIQGDRLSMNAPDMSPIARGIQQIGNAVGGLAEKWQADQKKMDTYNANLALERWSNDAAVNYEQNLKGSAPDGAGFMETQQKYLQDSFMKVRNTIKDPELQAKADIIFEQTKGRHQLTGMKDVEKKQTSYVLSTTGDSIKSTIETGQIGTREQYTDYFDNVVKPRIDSVIDDPLERKRAYDLFGKQMRGEFLKRNPAYIGQTQKVSGGTVAGGDFGKQLAFVAHELNGSEGAAGRMLKSASTIEEATAAGISYERPMGWTPANPSAGHGFANRLRNAKMVLAGKAPARAMQARAYLEGQGYTAVQASGMVGNLMQESGANLNPNARNPNDPGTSIGIGQWNRERKAKMLAFTGQAADVAMPDGSGLVHQSVPSGGMWDGMSDTEWNSHVNAARAQMRGDIAAVAKDELSSLEATGEYTGRQIGADDFNTAFAEDGPARFAEYEDKRAIAKQMHAYQDMSEAQILADINTRTDATPTGEGAGAYIENLDALKAKAKSVISAREAQLNAAESRHNAKVVAANAALEMRDKDPAGYVFKTNDAVRRAWRNFSPSDPDSLALAISETITAQEAIGIAPGKIQPLPTAQASEIVTRINDDQAKVEDRMDLLFSTVSQTENPEHQRAIMRQLEKAGAPSGSEVVYDAWLRNDMGAARRLFTAAVSKAENLPGKGAREAGFDDAVNDALAGVGTIGAAMYGMDYRDPSGLAMLERDAALAKKAATIAMANAASQSDAIAQAVKDIQGDGVLIDMPLMSSGGNVLGVVPADMNQDVLGMGMAKVVPEVRDALTAMVADQLAKIGDLGANTNLLSSTAGIEIEAVLNSGAFRNYGDGWGFFDARSNSFVAGRDGKPLTWTTKELMAMGMAPVDQAPDTGPVTDPLGNMQ